MSKERFNHQKKKEETNTDLWTESPNGRKVLHAP
jgi:hypothetical protein